MVNELSIIRKAVPVRDISGKGEQPCTENWVKLYDFTCVDDHDGEPSAEQSFELNPRASVITDQNRHTFIFDDYAQKVKPPYDIQKGDFVTYKQGEVIYKWKIIKILPVDMQGCCTYELFCERTLPAGDKTPLSCGAMQTLTDEEISNF